MRAGSGGSALGGHAPARGSESAWVSRLEGSTKSHGVVVGLVCDARGRMLEARCGRRRSEDYGSGMMGRSRRAMGGNAMCLTLYTSRKF